MDIDPIDVQRHLKGADYPATREELVEVAEDNDAPADILEAIGSLPQEEFDGPDEVMHALASE